MREGGKNGVKLKCCVMCRCSKWILVYISKDKNLKILFKVNDSVTIFLYKCAYIFYYFRTEK